MKGQTLKSIIYISTKTKNFSEEELGQLVESASTFNAANDITGCLIYNGMNFIQLIEGEADAIHRCMERISADERHTGIVIVRDLDIEKRECPDWNMVGQSVSQQPVDEEKEGVAQLLAMADANTQMLFTSFATL